MSDEKFELKEYFRKLMLLSDEKGYDFGALLNFGGFSEDDHIDAVEYTRRYIRHLIEKDIDVREELGKLNIETSRDLGVLVFDLVGIDMINASETDTVEDFEGIFVTDEIEAFITAENLDKPAKKRHYDFHTILHYAMIMVGAILVAFGLSASTRAHFGGLGLVNLLLGYYVFKRSK